MCMASADGGMLSLFERLEENRSKNLVKWIQDLLSSCSGELDAGGGVKFCKYFIFKDLADVCVAALFGAAYRG